MADFVPIEQMPCSIHRRINKADHAPFARLRRNRINARAEITDLRTRYPAINMKHDGPV